MGKGATRNCAEALKLKLRAPDTFIDSRFSGATILAYLGRLDEARRWTEIGLAKLAATPGGALAIAEGRVVELLLSNNPWFREEDRDHFAEVGAKQGCPAN